MYANKKKSVMEVETSAAARGTIDYLETKYASWKVATFSTVEPVPIKSSGYIIPTPPLAPIPQVFSLYSNLTRGNEDVNNVTGNSAVPQSIEGHVRFEFGRRPDITAAVRFIIYAATGKEGDGSIDRFWGTDNLGNVTTPTAQRSIEGNINFVQLYDSHVQTLDYITSPVIDFDFYVSKKLLPEVKFGEGVPGKDIVSGGIYAMALSSKNSDIPPLLSMTSEVYFTNK